MHQSAVSLRSRSQEYSDNLGKVGLINWKKWRYLQCASPSGCASTCSWNVVTTPTILTVAAFFAALTIGLVWAFNVALLACKNNTENNLETLFFVLFCSSYYVISSVTSISSQRIKADHYPFVSDHDKKMRYTTVSVLTGSMWHCYQCFHKTSKVLDSTPI